MTLSKDEISLQQWLMKQDDFIHILKSKLSTSTTTTTVTDHHGHSSTVGASSTSSSSIFHVHLHRFGYGQSNPTYRLDIIILNNNNNVTLSFVLRQKPYKIAHPSAHAIHREYRVLQSIQKYNNDIIQQQNEYDQKQQEEDQKHWESSKLIPVPNVYIYCNDRNVMGSEFYIMEYINGRIFTDPTLPELTSYNDRMIAYHHIIQVLANIHSIPYQQYRLNDYGGGSSTNNKSQDNKNKKSYVERQLERLISVSEQQTKLLLSSSSSTLKKDKSINENSNEINYLSKLLLQYSNECPIKDNVQCLIHGDYKIDNIVFHPNKPYIIGILDFELSTIGDPYCDVANLSMMYYTPRHSDNINNSDNDNDNSDSKTNSKKKKKKKVVVHTAIHQGFGQLNNNDLYILGIPNRYELIQYYCTQYNHNHNANTIIMNDNILIIQQWSYFYLSFLFFKNCIIVQGVQQRIISKVASNISLNVNELLPQLIDKTKLLLQYHTNEIIQKQKQQTSKSMIHHDDQKLPSSRL